MNDKFLQFLALTKRAGKLAEGYNKCEEMIRNKEGFLCIISKDISVNSYEKFQRLCERYGVDLIQCYAKEELGSILGRDEINVLCVLDKNMSIRLIEILKSVENKPGVNICPK
jgi:Ribosomal protein HS6-type (S12/L30/L7a)